MNEKTKKILPHIMAISIFFGLTLIYFYPIVFENKELYQADLRNIVGWGKDLIDYYQNNPGADPVFWSNTMFSGMPANYTLMPPMFNLFRVVDLLRHHVFPQNTMLLFLYLIGFYIFMISLGCKPSLSIIGAIAYSFTSYNFIIIDVGHVNKALVMSTMAPVIGGILLCYRKKFLWGSIVTLVFTGINVLWSHQQVSYYLLLTILIIAIVYLIYAIKEKTLKDYFISSALLLVIAACAIAPELGKLLSTAEYSKETMRGGSVLTNKTEGQKESSGLDIDYAFAWSYGKGETMTLLIPNFYGASSHYNVGEKSAVYELYKKAGYSAKQAAQGSSMVYTFWGDKPGTAGPAYAGAIVCFLFVLGLMILKGKEKWWLLAATVLSFVLAWGKNFAVVNNFLFYHLPLLSKFRAVETALVIAEVTMAAMAILALKEIIENKGDRKMYLKPVYISAGITGGLCLIYALFGSALMSFSGITDTAIESQQGPEMLAAIVSDRKSMLASDSWRSFIFIALATGTLWYYFQKKIKSSFVIPFIGVLILIDLWTVDKRFLNDSSFVPKQKPPTETAIDSQIRKDKDIYRVLDITTSTFNESRTAYFHKSIGGYSPAKMRRYQDIIEHHIAPYIEENYFVDNFNSNVLNMLNMRYVIRQTQQRQAYLEKNKEALGNAWFVNELKWVNSPDEEIIALKNINPAQTAVIDKEWQSSLKDWELLQQEKDSASFIGLKDYANPGNLFYESVSSTPQLAVFSEVYYKTWRAYIDGVEAPVIQVNYILRGLQVPAGNHIIEFRCVDETFLKGAKISRITSIFVGIILFGLFGYAVWESRKSFMKTGG